METNKLVAGIVATAIAVIVLAGVLMPALDGATSPKTIVYTNDGVRMSPVGDSEVTITFNNNVWSIGDNVLGLGDFPISQGTQMLYGVNHTNDGGYLYTNDSDTYSRSLVKKGDNSTFIYDGTTKTLNVTVIRGANTYTGSYQYHGEVYYNDPSGNYIWSSEKPSTVYIPDDWSQFNCWSVGAQHFYAVIGDDYILADGTESETAYCVKTTSNIDRTTGVKILNSCQLFLTEDADPIDCRGYILPYQISATYTPPTNDYSAIFGAIPIIIIVTILLGVVTIFVYRRG